MKRDKPVQTRYARTSDGIYLGYQVAGDGPIDLVWQPDWPGNIDMEWEFRVVRGYLDALSQFGRLILHDHRGVGLSSRNVPIPNLETRVSDLLVILRAVAAEHPVLVGWGSSPSVHALLASTRPELVAAMVWMDATPRTSRAPDYPWGRTTDELNAELDDLQLWGHGGLQPRLRRGTGAGRCLDPRRRRSGVRESEQECVHARRCDRTHEDVGGNGCSKRASDDPRALAIPLPTWLGCSGADPRRSHASPRRRVRPDRRRPVQS